MRFIESTSSEQGLPPFEMPGCTVRMFLLQADLGKLNDYLDGTLNAISDQFHFHAFLPYVYVGINDYPLMYSVFPGMRDAGHVSQREFYVTLPVMRHDLTLDNLLLPVEFSWAFPFIGVDNPTSAFTGREVLGFGKQLGEISIEIAADGSFRADVAMPAFAAGVKDPAEEVLPLISVVTGPLSPSPAAMEHMYPWTLFNIPEMAGTMGEVEKLLVGTIDPGTQSAINLKQFRDAQSPRDASYQALVRSEFNLTNTEPMTIYENATVTINDNGTFPITSLLGLGAGPSFKAIMATLEQGDMLYGNAVNLVVSR